MNHEITLKSTQSNDMEDIIKYLLIQRCKVGALVVYVSKRMGNISEENKKG